MGVGHVYPEIRSLWVQELSESLVDIDRERRNTPAELLNVQWYWLLARLQALKYRAETKRDWSDEFFSVLFQTLEDLDDVATTADNRHSRMHAKMMLVGESISYEAQLGPGLPGSAWRGTAEAALRQAEEIYLQHQNDLGWVEFTIGLARVVAGSVSGGQEMVIVTAREGTFMFLGDQLVSARAIPSASSGGSCSHSRYKE